MNHQLLLRCPLLLLLLLLWLLLLLMLTRRLARLRADSQQCSLASCRLP